MASYTKTKSAVTSSSNTMCILTNQVRLQFQPVATLHWSVMLWLAAVASYCTSSSDSVVRETACYLSNFVGYCWASVLWDGRDLPYCSPCWAALYPAVDCNRPSQKNITPSYWAKNANGMCESTSWDLVSGHCTISCVLCVISLLLRFPDTISISVSSR